MKNLLLFVLASTLTVFSCTQEELDNVENSDFLPTLILENEADSRNFNYSNNDSSDRALDIFICSRIDLLSTDDQKVGYVDFSLAYSKVIITYKVFSGFELMNTNLSLLDMVNTMSFPLDLNLEPNVEAFEFSDIHADGVSEFTYVIDQADYSDIYMFAAHALVRVNGGHHVDAWSHGQSFSPNGNATYTQFASGKCGVDYLMCIAEDDVDFYIPLQSATSGNFPDAGSNSDTVAITTESPTSQGVLDLELEFDGFPPKYGNAILSITFDDLDLVPEAIQGSGNTVMFSETFELRDEAGDVIAYLDASSGLDGNFTWTYDLPNSFFKDGKSKIRLFVTMTANLELIEGDGIQVRNTMEKMLDMSICGMQYGNIE